MTYKHIIENMIEMKAISKTEQLLESAGLSPYLFGESVTTMKDIDFGISFEVTATYKNHVLLINGYVDEYGGINVCTVWKKGNFNTLIFATVCSPDKWELLK